MGSGSSKKQKEKKGAKVQNAAGPPSKDTCGAWIAKDKGQELEWVEDWKLPTWGDDQIELEVTHNGLCHTDIHMRDNDWGISGYPLCAGHEVIGVVRHVGDKVTKIKVGDRVGVGWMKGSCGNCVKCENDCQSVCFENYKGTIVGVGPWKAEEASGGFAQRCRVNENFAFPIPDKITSESAAPLMCAGATVWAPLRRYVLKSEHGAKNMKIGIAGIGGLGHMALKLAAHMGCEIYALSSSDKKRDLVASCGEKINYVNMSNEEEKEGAKGLDFVLNTIPFDNDHGKLIAMLRHDGTYCNVGIPNQTFEVGVIPLVFLQYHIVGSIVAGRDDVMTMLAFCEKHGIAPKVVMKEMSEINWCMNEVLNNKVPHRYVLTFPEGAKEEVKPAAEEAEPAKPAAEEAKPADKRDPEDHGGEPVPNEE